jgi:hypothetical protein
MWKKLASICLVGALVALAGSFAPVRAAGNGEKGLQGAWDAVIDNSPFRILRSVSSESLTDAYAFPPFSPTPPGPIPFTNSSGHGAWEKTGPREYKVTVKYLQLNTAAGFFVFDTYGVVRETITVSKDGNSYTSVFDTEIFWPNNTSTGIVNHGTTTATRIQVQ